MRGALLLLFAALAALSFPQPADAQSFNCRFARSADEVVICRDERLSRLDERMSSLFFRVREDLGRRGARDLEEDQERFLRRRARCGPNPDCIEDAYRRRIDELRDYRRR
jgi:uncharacterized protein